MRMLDLRSLGELDAPATAENRATTTREGYRSVALALRLLTLSTAGIDGQSCM
jgi:hypothetical protein